MWGRLGGSQYNLQRQSDPWVKSWEMIRSSLDRQEKEISSTGNDINKIT